MFTHLHCHSHFSLLDGLPQVPQLIDKAVSLGFTSLALTDHGVLYGAIEFYNLCNEAGIKPIIGFEAYIAPRKMTDKEGRDDADYFHLVLLAKNYEGYRNLLRLTSIAHLEGYYYKPRLDHETLAAHSEGLIALSGCQRGEIARALMSGGLSAGRKILEFYTNTFGTENFYLEVQRNAIDAHEKAKETKLNELLVELARATNTPLVATNDCHYLAPSDSEAQDIMVCIGTGRTVTDPGRLNMTGHTLHLASPEEMERLFSDLPDAVENTQKIAESIDVTIPIDQRYFPKVKLPVGETAESELVKLTHEKASKFYADSSGTVPAEVMTRIDYELEIICKKGFASYFLMVMEITDAAHKLGAITNTRGSAAGSIVGRILEITNVDPLYFKIPFERFLSMHRPAPPDIDLDISDSHRDATIEYITNSFGKDKVAQIITFGTMQARAVVRDVGRALGVPYGKCDRIAKMIPIGKQGFNITLDKALDISKELGDAYKQDDDTRRIIDVSKKMEGVARHASIHAAGIIITPDPVVDIVPLQREPGGEKIITQYDMYALDVNASSKAIGAIKIDLLGIRNLSILGLAKNLVMKRHGIDVDLADLPQDDKKTYALLSAGHTFGVFQLGSGGMTRYLKELKPSNIFDIMAMIALYRPGPLQFIPDYIKRKHNPSLVTYLDPSLEKILSRTYGVLVFQDDLLTIAHDLAGYTWEEVDKFRKAVGKKDPEVMAKQRNKFIAGCVETAGWSQAKAEQIWTWIEPFAAYGFNKGHSASYAAVSYQTAYMKANYLVEFMAAVMTAESGNADKIYAAVEECKAMGIAVHPPDINESDSDFTVVDEKTIRFGLSAIKNLPEEYATSIQNARRTQAYTSLEDFLERSHHKNFNKKAWEALVKAGALDRFATRGVLLANTEAALQFVKDKFGSLDTKQQSLFSKDAFKSKLKLREVEDLTVEERSQYEKEILGLYVSSHPLSIYSKVMKFFAPISELLRDDVPDGSSVRVAGIITKLKRTITKKNEAMAVLSLEDFTGSIEAIVFPKNLEKVLGALAEDNVVEVSGKLTSREGEIKVLVDSMAVLPKDDAYQAQVDEIEKNLSMTIHVTGLDKAFLEELKTLLQQNPGEAQIFLEHLGKTIKTQLKVKLSEELIAQVKTLSAVAKIDTM